MYQVKCNGFSSCACTKAAPTWLYQLPPREPHPQEKVLSSSQGFKRAKRHHKSLPCRFSSAHQGYLSTCWNAKHASTSAVSAQGPQQAAATKRCLPHRRGFLGKTGDKGTEAPFGATQWRRKSQATAKVSKTGIGFRALSSVLSPTRDTRVSCSCSNATAKAASLFHSFRLSQLLRKLFQFCSEGVFDFSSNSMQAFFFNLPLAQSISYMNHNQEGWVKERGQVSQFLIDIY